MNPPSAEADRAAHSMEIKAKAQIKAIRGKGGKPTSQSVREEKVCGSHR